MTEHAPQGSSKMPSVFIGVGSPRQMWDEEWCGELSAWAKRMPRPKAILAFSAHWLHYPVQLGATTSVPLTYDYYNFPPHFYEVQYSAPPAPQLADQITELLGDKLDIETTNRGLDHGVFVGLMGMYPEADVPVLEVSIPTFDPEALYAIGACLAPLREQGVMIAGCGLLNHSAQSPEANRDFDAWVVETLERRDLEALFQYQDVAPGVHEALPTPEHFVPLLVAYGAAHDGDSEVVSGVEGFTERGGSKRSLQFS